MARNGLIYSPVMVNNSIMEYVTCSWCKVRLGPFGDLVPVEDIHRQVQGQVGLRCSFCR
jgi:hypothetical protein